MKKVKGLYLTQRAHCPWAYSCFLEIKAIGVSLLPLGWCYSIVRLPPSISVGFSDNMLVPIYIILDERGTVKVECFAQEHKKLPRAGLELLWKLAPSVKYGQFRFVSLLIKCTLVWLFVDLSGICITDSDYNVNEIYFLQLILVKNPHMTCR